MSTELVDMSLREAIQQLDRLVSEAEAGAEPVPVEVLEEIDNARSQPLDEQTATRLYTRILEIVRTSGVSDGSSASAEIRGAVEAAVARIERPQAPHASTTTGRVEMVERHGLAPHPVVPIPTFNGIGVSMTEGYVKTKDLALWEGNNRIDLHVLEFQEAHGRAPSAEELLLLVQGELVLPNQGDSDPFAIEPLADSIARKGVERPPILTWEGVPKDGNRRIAAALFVLRSKKYTPEQKDRARYVRVWQCPKGTTDDQFEAIVVALNFEEDHKKEWEEYIKARLVAARYDTLVESTKGRLSDAANRAFKKEVADHFAIPTANVTRYLKMVKWADDFEDFHTNDRARPTAQVRYRTNDTFQRFYELDAGKGAAKLTNKLDGDEELRSVVYDLMYEPEVVKSGTEVRNLHKIVADEDALALLFKAHEKVETDRDEARTLFEDALEEARRGDARRRKGLGLKQWCEKAVDKLDATAPEKWHDLDDELLGEFLRVLRQAADTVEHELNTRTARPGSR